MAHSNVIGKAGEKFFANASEQMGYKVKDLTNEREFWEKDIDFELTSPATNAKKYFEVKTDDKIATTGNLYVEIWNFASKGNKGWFNFTKTDYVAYIDWQNKIIYSFLLDELKQLIQSHNYRKRSCMNWKTFEEESQGILVPLADVRTLNSFVENKC